MGDKPETIQIEVPRSILVNVPQFKDGTTQAFNITAKTQVADLLAFALKERGNNDCGNAEGKGAAENGGEPDQKRLDSCKGKLAALAVAVETGTLSFKAGGGGSRITMEEEAMRAVLKGNVKLAARYGKDFGKAVTSWRTTIWPDIPAKAKAHFESACANRVKLMQIEREVEVEVDV